MNLRSNPEMLQDHDIRIRENDIQCICICAIEWAVPNKEDRPSPIFCVNVHNIFSDLTIKIVIIP